MLQNIVMENMVEIGSSDNWLTDLGMPRILLSCISLLIFAVANSCGGNMPNSYIIQKPVPKCNFLGAAALSGWLFRQLQGWLTPLLTMLRAVKLLLELSQGQVASKLSGAALCSSMVFFPLLPCLKKRKVRGSACCRVTKLICMPVIYDSSEQQPDLIPEISQSAFWIALKE